VNVGEVFGPYTIESVLGQGGMGTVFLARHARLERRVALKVISPAFADDSGFRARFLRESQLAASLDHPHVIPIYDADEIDGVLYLAMRYVDGPSLSALIRKSQPLSRGDTLRIAEQIGGALDAAHAADLIHRDLKPANILLTEADRHAYLCDFGLAKRTSTMGVTHAGAFLGTIDYCSPEQIRGEPLDGRADVYSFGCVLYHCLAGEPPYARENDIAVLQAHLNDPPPKLSPDLDGVFALAMAKDREERYATAGALAADLRAAVAGGAPETVAVPAERPTRVEETRVLPRQTRPRHWIWAVVLVVLLALVAAAAVAIWLTRDSSPEQTKTTNDMRRFVNRVENVLLQAEPGRREIADAITGGLACRIPNADAARQIASVESNRQSIVQQLYNLSGPTPATDRTAALLQRALQQSIEADRHYQLWFSSSTTCPPPANRSLARAQAADKSATKAKKLFVVRFNPLARRLHRRAWTAEEF
jgi:serine/threonine protein kinase